MAFRYPYPSTLDANRGGKTQFKKDHAPPWKNGFDVCFATESKVPTWNPMITPAEAAGDVKESLVEGKSFGTYYWTGPGQIETENLEGDDSRIIMDRVISFIEEAANKDQQFLSVVWFHTPHLPVLAGEDDKKKNYELSEDQQHYYGVISALDDQVGRLRDKLRELDIADNTVLFYTSDNGPERKSVEGRTRGITNGLKARKRSLYEGGIRVPGLMEWPGNIAPGTVVNTPCYTSEYFPTIASLIASLIGTDIEKNNRPFDGIDILPFVKGTKQERQQPLAFSFDQQAALIGHEYKLYSADGGKTFELYNLLKDPAEERNLATPEAEKLEEMASLWRSWKASQEASSEGDDY